MLVVFVANLARPAAAEADALAPTLGMTPYEARLALAAGPPSVVNDPAWAEFALAQAPLAGFAARVVEASPIGEDFAFYQQQIPGAFVMVGSGGPFAHAAAIALLQNTALDARTVVEKALGIAADICIYTNRNVTIETL